MTRTILRFGIISGILSAAFMSATIPFIDNLGHGAKGFVIGYTGMVLAFLLIYFGIRSFRDNEGGGSIGFWRGFVIGISITLISSCFYVLAWEIIFFKFMPHFMDSYNAQVLAHAKAAGATAAQLAATQAKLAAYTSSPIQNAAMTFLEPFPVGLLITLICAALLRRKSPTPPAPAAQPISA
jgi:hypothetical protein